jgi:hypothetical protein
VKVVWNVPKLGIPDQDGIWHYRLDWLRLPAHIGDVLHLQFHLPAGWRWKGPAPPATVSLDKDLHGAWMMTVPRG